MGLQPKLLYIVKFCAKSQVYNYKPDRYFYNPKKANELVDRYRNNEEYTAILFTVQPED